MILASELDGIESFIVELCLVDVLGTVLLLFSQCERRSLLIASIVL